jgi:iron complex outermembrane receptor protein
VHRALLLLGAALLVAPPALAQGPLDRPVSLTVRDVPLVEALLILRRVQHAPLAWRGDQLPPRHRVTLTRHDAPLGDVLAALLSGTLLTTRVTVGGTVVVVPGGAPDPTALATGIQALDQLLVIGSAVTPLPAREQPTAVTVVTERDLAMAPHRRLADQVRAFLPGLLLWDRGGVGPAPTLGGVRGVASFTARAPKVYVDGVEVASPELFTLLDGRTIAQIEMIHGPQGAALYGPDALGGVVEISTRKGTMGTAHVTPEAAAVAGALSREVDGTSMWREAALGGEAGAERSSAFALGSLTRLGIDGGGTRRWGAHAAGRLRLGQVTFEASGRIAEHDAPLESVTLSRDAVDRRDGQPFEERGGGIRVLQSFGARYSQTLVAGVHRVSGSREPFRSPILPPRLPGGATNETAERRSVRYSVMADFDRLLVAVGAEASHRTLERSARGNLEFSGISTLYDEALDSRGVFGQLRLRWGGLTVSGGARTDRINTVGVESTTPWAASAGAAYTLPLGTSTMRVRGAWGRAIRPPEPGMAAALVAGQIHQEGNSTLSPERQAGVELGLDLHLAAGAWFRATWFDQRADDLVQQVDLRRQLGTTHFYQFQNVGAITNRGWELDGGLAVGPFSAAVRLNLVASEIAELSPTYTGEFEVGDLPLEVPTAAGSVALRWEHREARVEVGASWLGSWTGYDWLLVAKAEAGQVALRDRAREYWLKYDGVVRPFVGARVPIAGSLAFWGRVELPLGDNVRLRDNLAPPLGQTVLVGVELR